MSLSKERLREGLQEAWRRGYNKGTQEKPDFVEENGWKMSLSKTWHCFYCEQYIEPGARHATEQEPLGDFYLCLTRHSNGEETGYKTPRHRLETRWYYG